MRAAPAVDMVVCLKHDENNPNAQKMVISSVDEKANKAKCQWVTKDGVPYQCEFSLGALEKFNAKRFEK